VKLRVPHDGGVVAWEWQGTANLCCMLFSGGGHQVAAQRTRRRHNAANGPAYGAEYVALWSARSGLALPALARMREAAFRRGLAGDRRGNFG
jgi:hypothetical protein